MLDLHPGMHLTIDLEGCADFLPTFAGMLERWVRNGS